MLSLDWMYILEKKICDAIKAGKVKGDISGRPDDVIESGLAHIFFYGDTVYKLYKTVDDKDHFIKGVLAPTKRRSDFIAHDYALNSHFSADVYKNIHSVSYANGEVVVGPYDKRAVYSLMEMSRLDFNTNLHERLLAGEVNHDELFSLGYETARAIDTCPVQAPANTNWYELASARVALLRQFVSWLPDTVSGKDALPACIDLLEAHLTQHREEYEAVSGSALAVNVDNHDENVFFADGKPQFIDLLPPMDSWWFGLPHANLSNLVINIETLHTADAARQVEKGYLSYHGETELPTHSYGFTHAFACLISIAHFGSVPGKEEVTQKYIERLSEIEEWL